MVPYDDHVVGFSSERVRTKGYIELYTTFDQDKKCKTIRIWYLVIDVNTSYNILLRQPSINQLMAIVSTPHLTMKFPSPTGDIITVHVDQKEARECYAESLRLEPLSNDVSTKRKSSRKDRASREARPMSVEPIVALVDLDLWASTASRRGTQYNYWNGHGNNRGNACRAKEERRSICVDTFRHAKRKPRHYYSQAVSV